jgi:hypothetical protein
MNSVLANGVNLPPSRANVLAAASENAAGVGRVTVEATSELEREIVREDCVVGTAIEV